MSTDKAAALDGVEEVRSQSPVYKPTFGGKIKAHLKKWWWAHLIFFVSSLLIIVLCL